jgi:methionine-rich copper-binding protein CopC
MKFKRITKALIFLNLGAAQAGLGAAEKQAGPVGLPEATNPFAYSMPGALPTTHLAHAILVKSIPEKDAVVSAAPEEMLLIFNDSVGQEFLALAVIDAAGKRVDQHDAKLDFTDHSHLRATVSKLTPGKYTVRYRVLSADGHVVSGKYFFQVQAP